MRFSAHSFALLSALVALGCHIPLAMAEPAAAGEPRVFLLVPKFLALSKQRVAAGDPDSVAALAELKKGADKLVSRQAVYSVMDKKETPPSGDKHDYMSVAPYYWPDPSKPGGKPYIHRDGEVNPERKALGDGTALGRCTGDVQTLALAYYFTGQEAYAQHAVRLLKTWFLDESTRMNPNLNYAQAVPGRSSGRGIGLIDTHAWIHLIDAVGLIEHSPAWTAADQKAMQKWFSTFVDWMITSRNGKEEAAASNNHGVAYDAQLACYSLFAGRPEVAKKVLQEAPARRIDKQIEPDGAQPRELARTKAWSYSCFNMTHWCSLARLGEHVGVDLWNYRSADGRSIRKAMDFLVPYATGEKQWTWKQITHFEPMDLAPILRQAAIHYPDGRYVPTLRKLGTGKSDSRLLLLYPLPDVK